MIASETGVTKTVDPIGGSYYVENLTAEIEERVEFHYLKRIERMGGALVLVEKGFFKMKFELTHTFSRKKSIDINV